MRRTLRVSRSADALKEELAIGAALRLRCTSDDVEAIVDAVVEYLIEAYPAQDVYIPQRSRLPVAAIRADIAAGESMRVICARYRADRRTIYAALDDVPGAGESP